MIFATFWNVNMLALNYALAQCMFVQILEFCVPNTKTTRLVLCSQNQTGIYSFIVENYLLYICFS